MSAITGSNESLYTIPSLTPQQQAESALLGGAGTAGTSGPDRSETPEQQADAAIIGVSAAAQAQSLTGEMAAGMPASAAEASQLVAQLAVDVTRSGSTASAAFAVLSASAAYSLTKP